MQSFFSTATTNPAVCLLDGGHNDESNSVALATVEANVTAMVQLCTSRSIPTFFVLLTPAYGASAKTASRMNTIDTVWNPALASTVTGLGATAIDLGPILGQWNTACSTSAMPLCQLQPDFDDSSNIHLSAHGAQAAGQEIARVIITTLSL
jgi:lysophospholipase L1-like esterase